MTDKIRFDPVTGWDPEAVARAFHETYERLAPEHGYETRKASAVPWEQVPANNRALMVDVADTVLARLSHSASDELLDFEGRYFAARDEVARLEAERDRLQAVVDVADDFWPLIESIYDQARGTWEHDDPRMKYVTVQISKVDLPTLHAAYALPPASASVDGDA